MVNVFVTDTSIRGEYIDQSDKDVNIVFLTTRPSNIYIYIYRYIHTLCDVIFVYCLKPPNGLGFTITLRHTTPSKTPLDELSARRRGLYLTTLERERHLCPRQDSNPQSLQVSNRRPTACI
jgi:hypothetical protein